MNSYERVQNAVKRLKTDVLPVGPYMGNHCAAVAGVRLIDYYTKPGEMAGAQDTAYQVYGQDIICIQSDNYYIAEGFGTKAEYYENSTPTLKTPAIESLKEVSSLKVPDPETGGRMPVYLEATEKLCGKYKNKVALRAAGTGPFSLAGHLLGVENLLMEIANVEHGLEEADEGALHHLMELTTQALISFALAELKAGADIVQCGDSLASLDMISPKIYEKYVFPYEKKFFSAVKPEADRRCAFSLLHICGDNTKVMELQAGTGADLLEVDYKIDLRLWKERVGDKVVLVGNLNPAGILLEGGVGDVRAACLDCIAAAADGGGFILGSGCEVPIYAPQENIKEMIRVARSCRQPV